MAKPPGYLLNFTLPRQAFRGAACASWVRVCALYRRERPQDFLAAVARPAGLYNAYKKRLPFLVIEARHPQNALQVFRALTAAIVRDHALHDAAVLGKAESIRELKQP